MEYIDQSIDHPTKHYLANRSAVLGNDKSLPNLTGCRGQIGDANAALCKTREFMLKKRRTK